jgi:hypothetical protein
VVQGTLAELMKQDLCFSHLSNHDGMIESDMQLLVLATES